VQGEERIYVPPDTRGNPFESRGRGGSRRWLLLGGADAVVLGAGGAALALLGGGPRSFDPNPGPRAAALGETDFSFSRDRETGYRRLSTPFADATVDRAAVGPDGTVAVAVRVASEPWVLIWRNGRSREHAFEEGNAVTALEVDPGGTVYVGFHDGTLARIGTADSVAREPAVEPGYSIVGFAFDRESRRSALMLSGGEVRTAMRPLRSDSLHTVTMPRRARVRVFGYDEDGTLFVGGDAGAVFASTDDGWDERTIPTSGRVTAFGNDADGELLAGQSNGHVFRASGASWDRIGQVSGSVSAVGELPEVGIVAATSNGRIWATLGREDLSEMPGFDPPGELAVNSAHVVGANVALAARDRLIVFDGSETFDSSSPPVVYPDGTVEPSAPEGDPDLRRALGAVVGPESCRPVGPPALGRDRVPPTLFDCGDERFALLRGGALTVAESIEVGGHEVAVGDFAAALRDRGHAHHVWVGGELWAATDPNRGASLPQIDRWNAETGTWEVVVAVDVEEGPLLDMSVARSDGAWELWTLSHSDTVRFGRVEPGASQAELEVVAEHDAFQEHYGGDWYPNRAEIVALGSERAVVLHDGRTASRVARGNDVVEPLHLPEPERYGGSYGWDPIRRGGKALLLGGTVLDLSPMEPPLAVELGAASVPARRRWPRFGLVAAATAPEDVVLIGRSADRRVPLRCREGRCAVVELPDYAVPRGVTFTEDGRLVVIEMDGFVGIVEPGGGG